MNFYYLLISLISAIILGIFSLARQFQMLQQNSYFPSRYTNWLSDNFPIVPCFIFFISSALFYFELYLIQLILITIYLIYSIFSAISLQKKSIKPLVFTSRIKRLFGASIIIFILLILGFILSYESFFSKLLSVICFILCFVSPILTYICWAITLPREKIFANFFIADAKKILKSHKNLKVSRC